MNVQATTLGGLSCQVVDDLPLGVAPRLAAVFCHGFGAPGTDLVPLGAEMIHRSSTLARSSRLIFPAAPHSLDEIGMFGGRAWWHLDIEKLNAAILTGEFRDQRKDNPEGLSQARAMLTALLDELRAETGLPQSRIILGGFSQGAILSTDVALHSEATPGGLCILSGTLLNEPTWTRLAPRRRGLRVVQSHGRQDPLLPFQAAVWLKELLEAAEAHVDFLAFDGEHTIPPEALTKIVALFEELAVNEPEGG